MKNRSLCFIDIGHVYYKEQAYAEGMEHYQRALDYYLSHCGELHPEVATIYNNMAVLHRIDKTYEKAIHYHQKALHIRKACFGESHLAVAHSHYNLALTYRFFANYQEAIHHHEKALRLYLVTLAPSNPQLAYAYYELAIAYYKQEQFAQAFITFTKAKQLFNHWAVSEPSGPTSVQRALDNTRYWITTQESVQHYTDLLLFERGDFQLQGALTASCLAIRQALSHADAQGLAVACGSLDQIEATRLLFPQGEEEESSQPLLSFLAAYYPEIVEALPVLFAPQAIDLAVKDHQGRSLPLRLIEEGQLTMLIHLLGQGKGMAASLEGAAEPSLLIALLKAKKHRGFAYATHVTFMEALELLITQGANVRSRTPRGTPASVLAFDIPTDPGLHKLLIEQGAGRDFLELLCYLAQEVERGEDPDAIDRFMAFSQLFRAQEKERQAAVESLSLLEERLSCLLPGDIERLIIAWVMGYYFTPVAAPCPC